MSTASRLACVVALAVLALTGTTAAPALAKGPTDVEVYGPGVDVDLTGTRRAGDVDLGTLAQAALLYDHWDGSGLGPAPPLTADQLGTRYVLNWTVAGMDWAFQHAYPFAEGGAWVRFGMSGTEGWVKAPALTEQLVELGAVDDVAEPAVAVEPEAAPATSAPEASTPEAAPAEDDAGSSYGVAVSAGGALAVALAAGVVVWWRRRLSR